MGTGAHWLAKVQELEAHGVPSNWAGNAAVLDRPRAEVVCWAHGLGWHRDLVREGLCPVEPLDDDCLTAQSLSFEE